MKDVLNVLWDWRFVIVAIISGILYFLKDWQKSKAALYNAMLQAKRKAKDGVLKSGNEQVEWIVNEAYQKLPRTWVKAVGKDNLRTLIAWLYRKGMDKLDDGKLNNSI